MRRGSIEPPQAAPLGAREPFGETLRKLEALIPEGWQPGDALPAEQAA